MAEKDSSFSTAVDSLFEGMEAFLTTKTVIGDIQKLPDGTFILPLVEVSFGLGAGAFENDKKKSNSGGIGGKIIPSAVLVVKDGSSKLVNVKNQDALNKIMDMVPDVVNRLTKGKSETEKQLEQTAKEAAQKMSQEQEQKEAAKGKKS